MAKPNKGEHVKFHCTILNSKKKAEYLSRREPGSEDNWNNGNSNANNGGGGGGRNNHNNGRQMYSKRETFDASLVLSVSNLIRINYTLNTGKLMSNITNIHFFLKMCRNSETMTLGRWILLKLN